MSAIVVAIGIKHDCKTMKEVLAPKNFARLHTIAHVPDRKTIAEEVLTTPVHFELHLKLPVTGVAWLENKLKIV